MPENKEVEDGSNPTLPDKYLKEQNRGILEVFSHSDHTVLTTSEIAEDVTISERHLRRRLEALEEEGILGMRKTSGVRLHWLETEVNEPITVKYPLLKFLIYRPGGLYILVGLLLGVTSALVSTATVFAIEYGVNIPLLSGAEALFGGVVIAFGSGLLLVVGVLVELINRVLDQIRGS